MFVLKIKVHNCLSKLVLLVLSGIRAVVREFFGPFRLYEYEFAIFDSSD